MISIDDLLTPVTEDQVNENFLSSMEVLNIPARSWRTGGALRTMLRVVARTYANFSVVMVSVLAGSFLEKSVGGWLTLLAYYVYGITRPAATYATGFARLSNASGLAYAFGISELRLINPTTKKAYFNTSPITLNPGDVLVAVAIQSVEQGTSNNASPGQISALESIVLGVTVTNVDAVVGQDEMKDPDLRQLCRDKLGTLSNGGPRRAYSYAVRSATRLDGTLTNVNRLTISPSSSLGRVVIYVAAPSGAPDPLDVGYVRASVEALARPDAVTAIVVAATEVAVARTLIVWATSRDGLSVASLASAVNTKLVAALSTYPIGGIAKPPSLQGYLYADYLTAIAKSADVSIFDIDGSGADIALNAGEVATLATVLDVRIVPVST